MLSKYMKKILVPYGKLRIVAEKAGCSEVHAKSCLRGAIDSELAKKVREIALSDEIGGLQYKK